MIHYRHYENANIFLLWSDVDPPWFRQEWSAVEMKSSSNIIINLSLETETQSFSRTIKKYIYIYLLLLPNAMTSLHFDFNPLPSSMMFPFDLLKEDIKYKSLSVVKLHIIFETWSANKLKSANFTLDFEPKLYENGLKLNRPPNIDQTSIAN